MILYCYTVARNYITDNQHNCCQCVTDHFTHWLYMYGVYRSI